MCHLDPILWYFLLTQLMAGVTTWYLYVFPGDEYGIVGPFHIQGMIVRNIHH